MSEADPARLIMETSPGEFRAGVFDVAGCPTHLFVERWQGRNEEMVYGGQYAALVRGLAPSLNGAFVEVETGDEAFLRVPRGVRLAEGERVRVLVEAERRHGKLARVRLTPEGQAEAVAGSGFDAWRDSLPFAVKEDGAADKSELDAAFDEALSASIPVPGGGQVWIERTRALVAVDIDTTDRPVRGSAVARALSVNRDAVDVLARHLVLRRFAGLAVIDCVGPLTKTTGDELRTRLGERLRFYSGDTVKVRGPSDLGLIQVSRPWRRTPIADLLLDEAGELSEESRLIDAMRSVERAARAEPARFFELALGDSSFRLYKAREAAGDMVFDVALAGRIQVVASAGRNTEVRRV